MNKEAKSFGTMPWETCGYHQRISVQQGPMLVVLATAIQQDYNDGHSSWSSQDFYHWIKRKKKRWINRKKIKQNETFGNNLLTLVQKSHLLQVITFSHASCLQFFLIQQEGDWSYAPATTYSQLNVVYQLVLSYMMCHHHDGESGLLSFCPCLFLSESVKQAKQCYR